VAEAFTAQQVGQVVAFVAPGFFARLSYNARFPSKSPEEFTLIVTAVVVSLPLVAITNALCKPLGISIQNVLTLPYVSLLIGLSVVAGYLAATIRAARGVRLLLSRFGLAYQPEGSVYAQTMLALRPSATVTVELLDGRRLSGTPRIGPGSTEDSVDELYITHPAWWDATARTWTDEGAGGGVIVPLGQVRCVTLDHDPT
jgi:hypothetical protein